MEPSFRAQENTKSLAGDQFSGAPPLLVTSWASEPSAFIVQILSARENAIRLESGDHTGQLSWGPSVSLFAFDPPTSMT
jgi:hypothetical protein